MKKIILIATIAIVVVGAFIGTLAVMNTPRRVVERSLTGVVENVMKRDEMKPIVGILTEGSVQLKVNTTESDHNIFDIPQGIDMSGKLFISKDGVMLQNMQFYYDGVQLAGDAYMGEDSIYVKNDDVLNGIWGVVRGSASEEFQNSVFAYGSGSPYAMDEYSYKHYLNMLEAYDEKADIELRKDIEQISKRYVKDVWDIVCSHAEFESDNDKLRIGGERISVRVITVTVDTHAMAGIVEEVYDYIADDDDLADCIEKYGDIYGDILETEYGIHDVSEYYDDWLDELDKEVERLIDELDHEKSDSIEVKVITPKMSSTLLKLEVSYGSEDWFTAEFGQQGIKKADTIRLDIYGDTYVYKIEQDDSERYEATLSVNNDESISLSVNRKRETYQLTVEKMKIRGSFIRKSNETTLTVETIDYDDVTENIYVELVLKEKDQMPKAEKDIESIFSVDSSILEQWEINWRKETNQTAETTDKDVIMEETEPLVWEDIAVYLIIKDGSYTVSDDIVFYSGYNPTLGDIIEKYCSDWGYDTPFDENGILKNIGDVRAENGRRWKAYNEAEGQSKAFEFIYDHRVNDGDCIVLVLE